VFEMTLKARAFAARWRAPRRALALAGALAGLGPAWAQSIEIGAPVCRRGVHVVARNAPAQEVLKAMATSLGFALSIETNIDSVVNIDAVVPMQDLLARVLPDANLIVSQKKDPACPGSYRIARVWVLQRAAPPPPTHFEP
jgi:hypothetical protein